MRFVIALSILALSAVPVSGQARFVEACQVSVQGDAGSAFEVDAVQMCQCTSDQAILSGARPSDLDRVVDHMGEDGTIEAVDMPDELAATSAIVSEVALECALVAVGVLPNPDGSMPEPQGAYAESFDPNVPAVIGGRAPARLDDPAEVGAVAGSAGTPAPAALPAGLSTGNGVDPVQTRQSGIGAAIRIVG